MSSTENIEAIWLQFQSLSSNKQTELITRYNVTYIVTVGMGKQLVAIYNVSFGRQILNWTI